jgi:hypothetical protein
MVAGEVYANPWSSYLIYFDTAEEGQDAEVDVDKRPITVADSFQPEFRLDISALDRKGTVSGVTLFMVGMVPYQRVPPGRPWP